MLNLHSIHGHRILGNSLGCGEGRGEEKNSKTVSSKFSSQAREVGDKMPVDDCPDKSASSVFKPMCPQKSWAKSNLQGYLDSLESVQGDWSAYLPLGLKNRLLAERPEHGTVSESRFVRGTCSLLFLEVCHRQSLTYWLWFSGMAVREGQSSLMYAKCHHV